MDELAQEYHGLTDVVYHIDWECPSGRQIPPDWLVLGRGGLLLCPTCRARSAAHPPSGPYVVPSSTDDSHRGAQ
jgi:hypothetical protein